ncbi:40s ribosomal protein [Nannochloropsis gaditana]|uniref:40s ribosomal protein n=1 Tax=Nannochloropsis gaditana TaxID=72520 RepID=W7TDH0_9STRA|nr:40s ribosomal protein [Nannochloropsis gaditana]
MGVRTKTVKKSARVIIEKYYSRLTMDFHTNKRVVDEVAEVPSKRMRNKIAGFVTHLMKRIQKGPVRGISLKLQEEERERRLDFVPEVSLIEQEQPEVDQDLRDLMEHIVSRGEETSCEDRGRHEQYETREDEEDGSVSERWTLSVPLRKEVFELLCQHAYSQKASKK